MSHLHKSKRYDPIDMFNDISRYLDGILIIDNPDCEKRIPNIYPAELQLNKASTSDKDTSFIDLVIKVIGSDVHTSVCDKRDDFWFPIVNLPWLSGDVSRLTFYGIYILQSVRFSSCCTSFLISILKIFKSIQNYWHRLTDIRSFEKYLEISSGHTLSFCPNFVHYRFKNMYPKLDLSSLPDGLSIAYSGGCFYIFLIYSFLSPNMFV